LRECEEKGTKGRKGRKISRVGVDEAAAIAERRWLCCAPGLAGSGTEKKKVARRENAAKKNAAEDRRGERATNQGVLARTAYPDQQQEQEGG
jgi:hypothetical protein